VSESGRFRQGAGGHPGGDCRRSGLMLTTLLIGIVFSVATRKLSCRAPGRCLLTQRRQAPLLGLSTIFVASGMSSEL